MTSFGQHAEENLQFIRRTMERSSTFTAVPGLLKVVVEGEESEQPEYRLLAAQEGNLMKCR